MGVRGYEVYRDGSKIGTGETTTYKDSNLTPGTTYTYTIRAYDGAGNTTGYSDSITVTTNTGGNSATIYYKRGFITPYIHYRPEGGTWTEAPGVPIEDSEIAGYSKITLFVDLATAVEAVFNDGNGTWDNNGGQNYFFPIGTSTFDSGTIIEGAPAIDTEAPTAPTNLTVESKTASTVSLVWTASTDNVGVSGYEIYQDGSKVATTANTNYLVKNLTSNTSVTFTVRGYDEAGNLSGESNQVTVTTDSGHSVTVYYKRGYTTPYIHYTPIGGAWTTPPGVLLENSEIGGYSKINLEVGSATGIEAAFTDGNGNWDNNRGGNYQFPTGTSTYENGTITSGAPIVDTQSPTAPADLVVMDQTSTTVSISWSASTDNVGVVGYQIARDGQEVASITGLSFTDTGLSLGTSYTYTVKAYDAVGNLSQASSVVTATSHTGNQATIYYKRGFTNPYIHYCPEGQSWTSVPGVQMEDSEVAGYSKITVYVDTATFVEAVFNDGNGTWDNNGGQNYVFSIGTSTFDQGQITTGAPVNDLEPLTAPTNLAMTSKSATSITLNWTAATDNVGVTGYEIYRDGVQVSTTENTSYMDMGLAVSTSYSYEVKAYDAVGNVSVASNLVTVTTDSGNIATIYYKHGYAQPYIHYAPLGGSWTTPPGVLMQNSEVQGYSKITLELSSATGVEAVFTDGDGNWDNNGGQNYIFPTGTSTFEFGTITEGAPQ